MDDKSKYGKCQICGKVTKLTFEHIPPHATNNKYPVKLLTPESIEKLLTDNDRMPWKTDNLKYINLQRGMGLYSLCKDCNNLTGAYYGEEYTGVTNEVLHYYSQHKAEIEDSTNFESQIKFHPLRFIKQVLSMFCSTTPNLSVEYPKIRSLILNKDEVCSDPDFKISMYLLKNSIYLSTGKMVMLYGVEDKIFNRIISEMDIYPFGFVLDYNKNISDHRFCDITSFLNYRYEDEATMQIVLPIYSKYSPIALDFRTKDEIANDIKKSKQTKSYQK
jgi:hypothetical protein